MKGFLFLGLVGAAIYALLVYTHHVLPGGEAEDTFAGQTQPNQQTQHLSSWGTHLESRHYQIRNSRRMLPMIMTPVNEPGAWYQVASERRICPGAVEGLGVLPRGCLTRLPTVQHQERFARGQTRRLLAPGALCPSLLETYDTSPSANMMVPIVSRNVVMTSRKRQASDDR